MFFREKSTKRISVSRMDRKATGRRLAGKAVGLREETVLLGCSAVRSLDEAAATYGGYSDDAVEPEAFCFG